MNSVFGCGHAVENQEVTLCKALQQLKNEHGPLRQQMDAFFVKAKQVVELEESNSSILGEMTELRKLVVEFERQLGPHSEREEGILFPAMVKYIGRETGPIAVMEYEHDQAKNNLACFLASTEELTAGMDYRNVAHYAIQAYLILTDHFMKEERVLFPMAQQILSHEEKKELLHQFVKS
ncbi:hemerythrin domain-containing protein [Ammoniphilus sp. YIM 78166]|uniref:hemerythrin domain-containing protein n=1 Tax=Ammoniphilus sp. YIM 78166 TaxID=1644106 RepID=UPI00106F3F6F|nr:hemerythrin domain-containing protein [Ammoniphilus sp. YIM 78166]